jgi:pimeloyl-ACP methyl ester carboxylesterase
LEARARHSYWLQAFANIEHRKVMDKRVSDEPHTVVDRTACELRLEKGRRIGFAEYGAPEGQPVIVLHGTPGSRMLFESTDSVARKMGFRIVAADRAGYGLSDPHHHATLKDTAYDIQALANGLGINRFFLVGFSGGGPHALAAALLMRDRIQQVALISPVGLVTDTEHVSMTSLQHFIFSYLGHSETAARVYFESVRSIVTWFPHSAEYLVTQYAAETDRAILDQYGLRHSLGTSMREGLTRSVEGAVQDLRLYCRPWGLSLHKLETPVTIWQGSEDTIVPPEAAYRLAGVLPNCRLEVLEGMGHYWLFGAFERILDRIRTKPPRRKRSASSPTQPGGPDDTAVYATIDP